MPRLTWRKEGTQIRKRMVPELTSVQLSKGRQVNAKSKAACDEEDD